MGILLVVLSACIVLLSIYTAVVKLLASHIHVCYYS